MKCIYCGANVSGEKWENDITKGFEEFTKMMFKQRSAEKERDKE